MRTVPKARIWVDISMRDGQTYIAVLIYVSGELVSQWAERVKNNFSSRGEYFAIYRAIQLAANMGFLNVEIKCDNKVAVRWAQKDDPEIIPDLLLRPIQADLFRIIEKFQYYAVRQIPRAENRAHALARKLLREAEICDSTSYFSPIRLGLEGRSKDHQPEVADEVEEEDD
jgi:ribonuclease HI